MKKKLKENIGKPKDLWKTLISKDFSVVQTNAIEDNKRLKYDLKSVAQTFEKFYSLLKNLPNSPSKCDMDSVCQYCKNIELEENFNLTLIMEKKVF